MIVTGNLKTLVIINITFCDFVISFREIRVRVRTLDGFCYWLKRRELAYWCDFWGL